MLATIADCILYTIVAIVCVVLLWDFINNTINRRFTAVMFYVVLVGATLLAGTAIMYG